MRFLILGKRTLGRTLRIFSFFVGFMVLGVFFQNFDNVLSLTAVNQKNRSQHAKELLGVAYHGSNAQKAEKLRNLQVSIYEKVARSLPKKYRQHSLALAQTIIAQAQAHNLDPVFIMAMIKTESSFNPKARGQFGEIGLMQLKPDTARWIAGLEHLPWHGPKTLENPVENVKLGVAYVAHLREKTAKSANKYVSAYNMGLAKVRKICATAHQPRVYSDRVLKNYKEYYAQLMAPTVTTLAVAKN